MNRRGHVIVEGRKILWTAMRGGTFYHGSPWLLPPNTLLTPSAARNYKQSRGAGVSITSDVDVAMWRGSKEGTVTGHVYAVEPIGEIDDWRTTLSDYGKAFDLLEGVVPKARVIRLIASRQPWLRRRR